MSQLGTSVGPLSLGTSKDGLRAANFDTWWDDQPETLDTSNEPADAVIREMSTANNDSYGGSRESPVLKWETCKIPTLTGRDWSRGIRKEFTVPFVSDGTSFQKTAWAALEKITYGKTICYEEQAILMGEPTKARDVGAANGKNPICLFVPCDRVIDKDGSLRGYASGLKMKQCLLDLEAGRLNHSQHREPAV